MALSPDDQFLAIGEEYGKITIKSLRDVFLPSYSAVSIVYCRLGAYRNGFTPRSPLDMETDYFVSQVPFIGITDTALDSWKQDRLADTDASLTGIITNSSHPSHDALANRALVRAHLRHWDVAIDDAESVSPHLIFHTLMLTMGLPKSIRIRPSVIGYIAKSVALIGGERKEQGYRVFDLAFKYCDPQTVNLLLVLKVCIPRMMEPGQLSATYF